MLSWKLGSICDAFICWLAKPFLKRCSWESFLTKIFTVCNFENILAITIIFSFKMVKLWCRFQKCNKKLKKKFFVFRKIASHFGVANSQNPEQDICHRQSIRKQKPPRFDLTLGETFSKSITLRMMKKHDKTALREISQVFGTLSHVDCQSVFWNGDF